MTAARKPPRGYSDRMHVLNNNNNKIINSVFFVYSPPQGLNFSLTANFNGFNTTLYNRQGCGSSSCEGVAILKELHVRVFSFPKMSKDELAAEYSQTIAMTKYQ